MISRRSLVLSSLALPLATAMASAAEAKTTIKVSFWDKPDMAMPDNMGMGMGGTMMMHSMGFTLSAAEAPAGDVTFEGTNDSKDLEHEMIVAPVPADNGPLPYDTSAGEVDEDAAGALGEIPETAPGASGKLTLHMTPGKYILFCNIAGHYMAGMWTVFTVT